MRGVLLSLAGAAALTGCDPGTRRPTFLPRPEAATTEVEQRVPAATTALAVALQSDSIPLRRVTPRDGYLESPWLDAATLRPSSRRAVGPSIVQIRGWVDPGRYGYSQLTVEVVYRTVADPSVPARETEIEVPYASRARERVRAVLGRLGGKPVDQPEAVATKLPPRRQRPDSTHAPGRPVANPIPSPASADSGTLLKGTKDSITSKAPAAAPTQGQRAAPPPAVAAPVSGQYSVQVAAVRTRAEADPIVAALVANGFPARIDTVDGWLKVRVGSYPTMAAAQGMFRSIKARQGGAPFIVRR